MDNIENYEATLNITWAGQNGDLPDPVAYDATDVDIKQWATEAVQQGVPGVDADLNADFGDFVVDRFPASQEIPYNRIFLRPKTPFGPLIGPHQQISAESMIDEYADCECESCVDYGDN